MFHLRLFGNPSITGEDGAVIAGRAVQRHRVALLALLARSSRWSLSRDKLLAYLWPERGRVPARQLLNQAVYHLRLALGQEAILSSGDELGLSLAGVGDLNQDGFDDFAAAAPLAGV